LALCAVADPVDARVMYGTVHPRTGVSTVSFVTLADGRFVQIRAMSGADGAALSEAVSHAADEDLRRRFMGSPPSIAALLIRLEAADGIHDAPIGAFDSDGRLVGVTQFNRTDDGPVAELAIEVATDWKRCGLGGALLRALCVAARGCGIDRLTAVYFSDNTAIIRLLRSTGCCCWLTSFSGASTADLDVRRMLR
jgi:RimJ/RimL family protein N-acetyltransferase